MSMKKTLLALTAVAALAFAALPAVASAVVFDTPPTSTFTVHGNTTLLTTEAAEVHCETATGSGLFSGENTGTVELTFHECELLGTSCQSGATEGTMETGNVAVPYHDNT